MTGSAAPWLAHYDEGVPASLAPYPQRTLVDYLADAARDRPRQAALLFKGATLTYGELDRLSEAGLIEIDEKLLKLTTRGALLSNEVFSAFV